MMRRSVQLRHLVRGSETGQVLTSSPVVMAGVTSDHYYRAKYVPNSFAREMVSESLALAKVHVRHRDTCGRSKIAVSWTLVPSDFSVYYASSREMWRGTV